MKKLTEFNQKFADIMNKTKSIPNKDLIDKSYKSNARKKVMVFSAEFKSIDTVNSNTTLKDRLVMASSSIGDQKLYTAKKIKIDDIISDFTSLIKGEIKNFVRNRPPADLTVEYFPDDKLYNAIIIDDNGVFDRIVSEKVTKKLNS